MPVRIQGRLMIMAWTRFVIRHALLIAMLSLLIGALLGVYAVRHLSIVTDTEDMIAEDLSWRQEFISFRERFPQRYRTIVVVVGGETEALADQAVRQLDTRLDGSPDLFESSYAPTADQPLAGRELLYLEQSDLDALVDNVAAAQPFIGRLRSDFALSTLLEMLTGALESDVDDATAAFLQRLSDVVDATLAGQSVQLDWSVSIDPPGKTNSPMRLIIVKPVLDFSAARPARRPIEALRAAAEHTERQFEEQVSIRLTGTVALEDEELLSVTRNVKVTGSLAFLSVMAVLLLAFRSLRLLLISILVLLTGLTGTAAFAAWSVGTLNIISVAFAILYIGLGIDFVIHYLLRVRESCAQGETLEKALEITSADVGSSLLICAVTTAAGFYSFIPTSFVGVSQLGLISGTGMFISLVTTLTLLPALLHLLFPARLPMDRSAADWQPGLRLSRLLKYPRTVVGVFVTAALAGLLVAGHIRFESDPMLLRDPQTESVMTFRDLNRDADTTSMSISILVDDSTEIPPLKSALLRKPTVERVVSLSSFEPSNVDDKLMALDDLQLMLGRSFEQFPAGEEVDTSETRDALQDTIEAAASSGTNDPAKAQLGASFTNLENRLEGLPEDEQQKMLVRLRDNLLQDLPRAMQLLASRLQPTLPDFEEFPESFVRRWQAPGGTRVVEVLPAVDLSIPANTSQFVAEVRSVAPEATGLAVVYEKAGATVVDAFGRAFAYAFIAISLLLLLFMRSVRDFALVLVPLALAAAITAGVMVMTGLPFNFANVIALPLLLGIGVDNGIHMVHRARHSAITSAAVLGTSTSRAILFSSLTTLASFGNLAFSSHRGMASMGMLLTIGLLVILTVMIIVVPALLAGSRS